MNELLNTQIYLSPEVIGGLAAYVVVLIMLFFSETY